MSTFKFRKPQWKFKLSPISQWKFKVLPSSKLGKLYVLSAFFTVLSIVLTLVFATRIYLIEDVSYNVPLEGNATTTKIVLVTHYIEVDATAGTLTTDWYPLADDCNNPEQIVNIFFDRNLLIDPSNTDEVPSDRPPEQPVFQFNTKSKCRGNIRDSFGTFRIVGKLIGQGSAGRFTGPSLQWYPFDIYFAQFSLFAQLNSTNASVGIITNEPFGSPVNFKVALNQEKSVNTDEGLYLHLDARRSGAVRLFAILIVLANWLASLAFLWITIASLLWPENVVKELFVIPIAALFAFTSVRSNMPGAPAGFGAFMDFVGILPNLASMAIFSATLLFVVLLRRTRGDLQESDGESGYGRNGRVNGEQAPNPKLDNDIASPLVPEKEMTPMSEIQPALSELSHDAAINGDNLSPEQNEKEVLEIDDTHPALSEVAAYNNNEANRISSEKIRV